MASPYTVRFALAEGVADTDTLIFTAPAGWAWIVRDVVVQVFLPTTAFYLQLKSAGRAVALLTQPISAAGSVHHEFRQRMDGGDTLVVHCVAAPWAIAVTGYQLSIT